MKKCNKCGEVKDFIFFGKEARAKNGYKPRCKKCTNEYYNSIYLKIKDGKIEKSKIDYQKNKAAILVKRKEYYEKNKPKILLRNKLYLRKRKIEFPYLRNLSSFRTLVKRMLKDTSKKTFEYLGYNFSDLIETLGRAPELGEQIDHKIPISWFVQGTEMKIIFSLNNLQILPASENASKGNRYCHEVDLKYYNLIKPHIKKEYLNQIKYHGTNRKNTVAQKPR